MLIFNKDKIISCINTFENEQIKINNYAQKNITKDDINFLINNYEQVLYSRPTDLKLEINSHYKNSNKKNFQELDGFCSSKGYLFYTKLFSLVIKSCNTVFSREIEIAKNINHIQLYKNITNISKYNKIISNNVIDRTTPELSAKETFLFYDLKYDIEFYIENESSIKVSFPVQYSKLFVVNIEKKINLELKTPDLLQCFDLLNNIITFTRNIIESYNQLLNINLNNIKYFNMSQFHANHSKNITLI